MYLACLGQFVFALDTAPYQELQRKTSWRHPTNETVGSRPRAQFVGLDKDDITLQGVLVPEITGDSSTLDQLRDMGNTGNGYVLSDGLGYIYGVFVIEDMDETKSVLLPNGTSKKIEFSINLKRIDDYSVDQLTA